MYGNPGLWRALLDRLADITIAFLKVQVAAGASAVQLFDSWAGVLSPQDYTGERAAARRRVFSALADTGVPRIHFGVGTGELLGCSARPAPTWSASTGGCRWTRPPAGSAPARRCRATSIRPCCSRPGR